MTKRCAVWVGWFLLLLSSSVFAGSPVIGGSPQTSVNAGANYQFTPVASDPDGDKLTFSIKGKPVWVLFDLGTGTLTGTPTSKQATTYKNITIMVSDGKSKAVALPAFSITVVNPPPVISGTPVTTLTVGNAYRFAPVASDPNNDALTFSITGKPVWATFDTKTGVLSGTPTAKQATVYKKITIQVSDGKNKVALPTFDLEVINPPPVISGTPATSILMGTSYRFAPVVSDPNSDPLTFSIIGKPTWAAFDTKTGVLSGKASVKQFTVHKNIIIQVSDGKTKVSLPAFDLAVVTSQPPVISGIPADKVIAGNVYRFTPVATDPENDVLTFTMTGHPAWLTLDSKTGELSGTPGEQYVGRYDGITLMVSDGSSRVSLPAFAIEVVDAAASVVCHVNYTITKQWSNGFTAEVVITNQGKAWKGWTATWDMPNAQTLSGGMWNANGSQSGSLVTATGLSWNSNVAKDGKVQFGFNGVHSGINNIPTNVSVNGVLCSGNAEPPPPPVVACDVTYTLVSEWDSGYTADIYIKNTGDTVNDWIVAWDMPDGQTVKDGWNGTFKQTESHVDVTHAGWNRVVDKNGSLQFGFNGIHQGLNRIPGNLTLNGVKCGGQVDPPPPPPPSCDVKYQIQKDWGQGFTGTVDIKNTGVPWNGWTTTWTMPTGQIVTAGWNANITQTDTKVTATHVDSNKMVRQNNNISFGFNASLSGLNVAPIDVAVNGTRCSGQSDKLVLPPKAPTQLQGTLVDNSYVDLTWKDNSTDEDNMVLMRRVNNGSWGILATLPADTLSYQDKTLEVGVTYEYYLKAVNVSGSSEYTGIVRFKRQDRNDIRAAMLVNNCAACHGTDGYSSGPGTPSIAGLSKSYLVRTMKAYRSGERASSVMSRIAKGYTDTQIERMADYLANLPYKANKQTTDAALVARGKAVHESNCQFCHAGIGNDAGFTKTLLDGQWSTYLHATLEDYYAGRSSNIPTEMANQLKGIKTTFGEDVLLALAQYYASDKGTGGGGGGDNGGGDPNTVPVAPGSLMAVVVDSGKVSLGWKDNSNNETGFRVERRPGGGNDAAWSTVTTLGSNSVAYTDTTAMMGASHDYRVVAFNAAGSAFSTVVANITLPTALQYGQSQYQRQGCASCHGADGKGGFTKIGLTRYTAADLGNLGNIIRDTMPPGNPGACTGNCATSVASYIIEVLVPAAGGGGGGGTQSCEGTPPAGVRSLRLLTRLEYQNTVNDLFGLSLNLVNSLPDENQVGGFDNNIAQNQVSSLRMDAYLTQAEKVAAQAVQDSWSKIMPCSQQDTACGRQFLQTFGKRAFRRPLTTAEVDTFAANFSGVAFRDAVEKTVMAMLVSPNFLYRSELGELQVDGTYKLTPYEVASSLSYLFWGSMPDDVLFQAADQNALDTPAQRIAQASRLLAASRSRQQVGNFVGQWLLKGSPYSLPAKDAGVYPAYTNEVKAALSQELINFFNYVTFDSTQSFRELYAADYVIANKTLADFYHLSGPSGSTFEKTPVTNGTRTGLLTLGSVLARYSNSNESHPFKRGRFYFERVLCHELPEPANFGLVQPPDPDPNMTTRQRFDFHSNAFPSCYSCHQYLDGPGFGFENYDGAGQFRSAENGKVINASAILRGMETYSPDEAITFSDLNHLSQLTADSPTAAQCVARQYYRYTTGRLESDADKCALDSYLQSYKDNGYNLQTMLISIVNAPNFTVRRAQ